MVIGHDYLNLPESIFTYVYKGLKKLDGEITFVSAGCLHSNTQQLACSVGNSRQKFPASQWKNLVRSSHTDTGTKFLIVSVNLFTNFRCNTITHKINKIKICLFHKSQSFDT